MARQVVNNDANNLLGVLAMIAEMRARKDQSAKEENRFNLQYKQGESNQAAMMAKIQADLEMGKERNKLDKEKYDAEMALKKDEMMGRNRSALDGVVTGILGLPKEEYSYDRKKELIKKAYQRYGIPYDEDWDVSNKAVATTGKESFPHGVGRSPYSLDKTGQEKWDELLNKTTGLYGFKAFKKGFPTDLNNPQPVDNPSDVYGPLQEALKGGYVDYAPIQEALDADRKLRLRG
jgi:hypothetical protein